MRVLWSINIVPAFPASQFGLDISPMGGWLMSMAESILAMDKDIVLCLVSVSNVSALSRCEQGRITYYVIPDKEQDFSGCWAQIVAAFGPDIVHIQGTEYSYKLPLVESPHTYRVVASIQGLIMEYAKHYYGGVSSRDRIVNTTLRDIVRTTMRQEKKDFEKRGEAELRMLQGADYIIGRTDWDRSVCQQYQLDGKYRKCGENLRGAFYGRSWDDAAITPHSIFLSQGAVPYKGLHKAIEALAIVRKKYPDAVMRIAGINIMQTMRGRGRLHQHAYAKYVAKLIDRYGLQDSVFFLGKLDEQSMLNEYLKANCFVQPSAIENSPNSLGEALLVGTPAVASFVGGTGNFLRHGENGFAYPFEEAALLAHYIDRLFSDRELCRRFSAASRADAAKFYDREQNTRDMLSVYAEAAGSL